VIISDIVGGHTLFRLHEDTRKREKYFKTAVEATGQRGLRLAAHMELRFTNIYSFLSLSLFLRLLDERQKEKK